MPLVPRPGSRTSGIAEPASAVDRGARWPIGIEYSPECEGHLRALTARERAMLLDAVDEQLAHQPTVEALNRKPMRPNPLAPWELRIGDLRAYYDVSEGLDDAVVVRAVEIKERDVVRIGGMEVKL